MKTEMFHSNSMVPSIKHALSIDIESNNYILLQNSPAHYINL